MNRIVHAAAIASVIAAGAAVSPAAHADTTWSSIFAEVNGHRWGVSDNYPNAGAARGAAADECQRTGAPVCRELATGQGCVSAADNGTRWHGAAADGRAYTESLALLGLPGGHIVVTRC
jgi:uncharacterized protein DUF4189